MSKNMIVLWACIAAMGLFQDVLRVWLAIDGTLAWGPPQFFQFFPSTVSWLDVVWIPIDLVILVWVWRRLPWKSQ